MATSPQRAPHPTSPPDSPEAGTDREQDGSGHGIAGRLAAVVTEVVGSMPVRLRAWDGSEAGPVGGPIVVLRSRRALRRLLWDPNELGLARAFVTGELDVDGDLETALSTCWTLLRAGGPNRPSLSKTKRAGLAARAMRIGAVGPRPAPPRQEAKLGGTRHTRHRDADAISFHYDLGNDFYAAVLDETMAYSSAYWTRSDPSYTLANAQHDKLDLICRKLGLCAGNRLLDVGCGWGSLILHAAKHYGVRATGVTLSVRQRDYVTAAIARQGLDSLVTVRRQDYRELDGEPFDAVASIEMGEHVGDENYPRYAATVRRMVRPTGRVLIQQMSRGATAPGGGEFIERYIAPDMHMRPLGATIGLLERAGLEVRDVESLREHYVRTARAWSKTLEERQVEIVAIAGDAVARIWRLYLAGGALSFAENRMSVHQILAVRPTSAGMSAVPPTRRDWIAPIATGR